MIEKEKKKNREQEKERLASCHPVHGKCNTRNSSCSKFRRKEGAVVFIQYVQLYAAYPYHTWSMLG